MISQLQVCGGAFFGHLDAALAELFRLNGAHAPKLGPRRDAAERLVHAPQHIIGLHVSDDDEGGVVGDVIAPVVAVKVVARHRFEIGLPSDGGMPVWVHLERRGNHFLFQQIVGSFSPPCNSEMMTVRSDSQSSGAYTQFAMRSDSMNSIRSSPAVDAVSM